MICIYAIINIVDDKHYVGQAIDRDYRWQIHRKELRGFYHHSILLQRAWCKHGEKNFIFVVLEVLDSIKDLDIIKQKQILDAREQWWMDRLKSEYNIAKVAGSMLGYKHTDEAREKMSKSNKTVHSEEHKKNLSERMKGNTINNGRKQSLEVIEHRAKFHRGKITSEETKVKMSISNSGKKHTDTAKIKMSWSHTGKKLSDDHKQKLSEAAKRQWQRTLTEI